MSHKLSGKVVVTGGAGFIGSHIVEKLINETNAEVTVIDDLSTGYRKNIDSFRDRINFREGSITDLNFLQNACEGAHYIIHQAAMASVPRSIESIRETHEVNATGTLNVFLAARDNNVRRVVYASSSAVYGDSEILPKEESMEQNPLSPYALHKAIDEAYGKLFYELYGLETVGLRYFNVFGPRQDPDSPYAAVIPLFAKLIAEGKQPVIFGDGETSRDFTYVDNVVSANLKACVAKNAPGNVYNIACGSCISLNELIEKINTILGTDISPRYTDFREGDIKHSLADIARAQKELRYEVEVDFDEGLRKTIKP